MDAGALVSELKRRRVFRALVGYGIAAFAVLQIIEPVMHGLHWPDETLSYVVVALAVGFPVVVALAWIFDVKSGHLERTPSSGLPYRAWLAPTLIGIGALAAAPGLFYYLVVRAPRPEASIAVLPLVNLSRDPDQEYFADGLAEELLDLLAKVPGLHVAARTSAFSFKGKSEDVSVIGTKLKVATVLEGSVRKSGDQVRINTQLINVADGYNLWSETYDRKLTDVFAVQDDIARSVVLALKLKLLPVQVPTSKDHKTSAPEAYLQYLLGRQLINRNDRQAYLQSREAFRKAIALDAGFGPAWAGLARAEYWIADSEPAAADIAAGQQRAREAAEKAVALAPDAPEARVARGFIRAQVDFDWTGGQSDFERALAVSPDDADVIREYATSVLRPLGRGDELVSFSRKAAKLDPLNSASWTMLGAALFRTGQLEPAREALERSMQLNPQQAFSPGFLGCILLLQGRPADGLQQMEKSTSEVFRLTGKGLAYHSMGREDESNAALQALISKHGNDAAFQIAVVYAWRDEKDLALQWLERARLQHDGGLTTLKLEPFVRSLRGDPRFADFLRRMNLPPD